MTEIYRDHGLKFYMYNKTGNSGNREEHDPAHLHIVYSSFSCKIEIKTLKFYDIKGNGLNRSKKRIISRIIKRFQNKLLQMWNTQNITALED